jgi:hypothetical protein
MSGRSQRRRTAAIAIVAGTAFAVPGTAAAGVPKGSYGCYGETSSYIGTLKIKSSTRYSYLGENGEYRFKAGPKVLKFKSGALESWVGKLLKADGEPVIKLVTDEAGGQSVDCY